MKKAEHRHQSIENDAIDSPFQTIAKSMDRSIDKMFHIIAYRRVVLFLLVLNKEIRRDN